MDNSRHTTIYYIFLSAFLTLCLVSCDQNLPKVKVTKKLDVSNLKIMTGPPLGYDSTFIFFDLTNNLDDSIKIYASRQPNDKSNCLALWYNIKHITNSGDWSMIACRLGLSPDTITMAPKSRQNFYLPINPTRADTILALTKYDIVRGNVGRQKLPFYLKITSDSVYQFLPDSTTTKMTDR